MLCNMLNDLAEAIRRWTEKKHGGDFQSTQLKDGKDVVLNVTALFAVEKVTIGIPSDPEQFIERAIAAGHPRNLDQFVDPQVKSLIHANFVEEPAELAKERVAFFKKYLKRASELRHEEEAMGQRCPPMC